MKNKKGMRFFIAAATLLVAGYFFKIPHILASGYYSLGGFWSVGAQGFVLAAGGDHSCAAYAGGLKCWGNNDFGQLGDGTQTNSSVPVVVFPPNSGVTYVSAAGSNTCAVVSGGVQCWGSNYYGQLGNGTGNGSSSEDSSTPVTAIPAGSNAAMVYIGQSEDELSVTVCAVVAGGVQCWGNNGFAAMGNGVSGGYYPSPVVAIAAGSGATAVATGCDHSCAVVNGGLQCWGENVWGQLGDGTSGTGNYQYSPENIYPAGSGITSVVAMFSNTCILKGDGVNCWGYGIDGTVGNGTNIDEPSPVVTIVSGSGVTALSASALSSGGYGSVAALTGTGIQSWGDNTDGQLGTGNEVSPQLSAVTTGGSGVTKISEGASCSPSWKGCSAVNNACDLVGNTVQCWGDNNYGQLGNGTTTSSLTPVTVSDIP